MALVALNGSKGQTLLGLAHIELRRWSRLSAWAPRSVLGLAAGVMPAWGAYRAKVTEMLRNP
jgi:hypothetical protein